MKKNINLILIILSLIFFVSTIEAKKNSLCSRIPPKEIIKIFGHKNTFLELSKNKQCIISDKNSDGSLIIINRNISVKSFRNMVTLYKKYCETKTLSYLSKYALAYYNCQTPENNVLNIELFKNNHHLSISYKPSNRTVSTKDLKSLKPLLKHIFKTL